MHLERLAFPHPFRKGELSIEAPTPRAFRSYLTSQILLEEHLHAALAARLGLLLDSETDCYRLFTGRNEGIAGLVAERYGPAVVIETLAGKYQGDEALLRQAANFYARTLGVKCVYAKHIPKRRDDTKATADQSRIQVLKGEDVGEITVRENGLRFLVSPGDGLSIGIFLDQRDNRRRIARLSEGRCVLNLFAFTCTFSVAAAAGGAASTTSVDQTVGVLEGGKRNFAANGLSLDNQVFIKSEVFEYFKRAKRQEKAFDVVILDPPSFARMKKPKRTFEVKRHMVDLLAECLGLLSPGGHLLVSTNNRQLPLAWLIEQVEIAWEGVPYKVTAKPKLPPDFAPDAAYQKAIVVKRL